MPKDRSTSSKTSSVGKRVGGFVYIHRSAADLLSDTDRQLLAAATSQMQDFDWNVCKVGTGAVSLLRYEDFDKAPFPALLAPAAPTYYSTRENPPILHRKELLLPPDDPRRERFAALTRDAEAACRFEEAQGRSSRSLAGAARQCQTDGARASARVFR